MTLQYQVVSNTASVHPDASIGNFCVIGDYAEIAAGVVLEDYAMVQSNSRVGERSRIGTYCKIGRNVSIGQDCSFTSYCEIRDNCRLGNRVIMGSRGTLSAGTVVGDDVIMKYSFVVTDTPDLTRNEQKRVGKIGNGARFGALVALMPGVCIGDNSEIGAFSLVRSDVPRDEVWFGIPAKPYKKISKPNAT